MPQGKVKEAAAAGAVWVQAAAVAAAGGHQAPAATLQVNVVGNGYAIRYGVGPATWVNGCAPGYVHLLRGLVMAE